jgi:hypothetical protein
VVTSQTITQPTAITISDFLQPLQRVERVMVQQLHHQVVVQALIPTHGRVEQQPQQQQIWRQAPIR